MAMRWPPALGSVGRCCAARACRTTWPRLSMPRGGDATPGPAHDTMRQCVVVALRALVLSCCVV
eukprot:5838297-Lingulodinium_polyedra.AAC.1